STACPIVTISSNPPSGGTLVEGYAASVFQLYVKSGSTSGVTVELTASGTATPCVDYSCVPSQVTTESGSGYSEAFRIVYMGVHEDCKLNEGTETLTISIKPSPNYTIGSPSSTTLSILDIGPGPCQSYCPCP